MRRVVVDTSVLMSAVYRPKSLPGTALRRVAEQGVLLISSATLAEFDAVAARPKWQRFGARLAQMREYLLAFSTQVDVVSEISDCRDPKDNIFLALALDGAATYIVTGDEDLLILHPWRGVSILTPVGFLETLGDQEDRE